MAKNGSSIIIFSHSLVQAFVLFQRFQVVIFAMPGHVCYCTSIYPKASMLF